MFIIRPWSSKELTPKPNLSAREPVYQMQLQTAADVQSRSSKRNYQNQNNPIYIKEAKFGFFFFFSMCFPIISTGKLADVLKRALIHRASIVFKILIKDILLISLVVFAAKCGNKGAELFVRNVKN